MHDDSLTVVISHGRGGDKPFELCVSVDTADGETRLEHHDYLVTAEELSTIRAEIDKFLESTQ